MKVLESRIVALMGVLALLFSEGFAQRPNVVLVITDDQGYSDVGFNGNPHLKTPVLDRFASEATVFEQFYACPVCSPTRASLMTGRSALKTGVIDTQEARSILKPSEVTIAEALKGAGYRTGMFGKWHLGDNAPARPIDQGFDYSLTHVGGMIGAPYSPLGRDNYFNAPLLENGIEREFEGYCVDAFTDAAVEFIAEAGEKPFFVYWAPNTPHHPLTVADSYADPYREAGLSEETARYYGMITNIDDNFGRIVDAVDRAGASENTLFVFVGDNGTSSLHKQEDLWESGLRGRKTYVYENGIRVPALIKLPGGKGNGKRLNEVGSVEDLMPTILDVCKVPYPEKVAFDGRSLLPLLDEGETDWPERTFYFQFHRGLEPERYRNIAVRNGHFKLVQAVGRGIEPYSLETAKFELYDLSADPLETKDLAGDRPEIVERLKERYDSWFDGVMESDFTSVRTWVGSERENPVVLSRQDWKGGGLFDGDNGVFSLDVKTAGYYRITCQWSELLKKTHPVTLKVGESVIENSILYAESQCRFEKVYLEKGPVSFEAWVEIEDEKNGFRFIEIEKL
ncbi:arylsulfatase [Pelagicoccus mobilis]|uniref:Arylsulfatase n=1 Tax=Pelagicoccus mobilis TaxID=415221 RepID=A0A934RX36_9BACT|nr:arylsulfatase [Pelagicoccus mobilis]MBK1875469.1 arylsulfatase [Pelagicoccus mobilis]